MNRVIDAVSMHAVLVGPADPEIVELEAQVCSAQLRADVGTLDSLISSELLFTGPDGRLGSKQQDLTAYRSGVVRFLEHEPRELRISTCQPCISMR